LSVNARREMANKFNPWTEYWRAAAAMNAAGVTIVARTVKMQQAMLAGDLTGGPESARMVTEKVQAAQEGYFASAEAMAKIATGPALTVEAYWDAVLHGAAAFTRPGYRAAQANAKRLTRKR